MNIAEEKLLDYLKKEQVDAFYVHSPLNVRYICKYSGGDAYLLVLKNKRYLLTDPRCLEHAQSECPEYECVDWRPYGSIASCLGEIVKKENISKLAIESHILSAAMFEEIQNTCQCEFCFCDGIIEDFQVVKDEEELCCIKKAIEISERALQKLYKDIRPGITEKELEARLAMYMAQEDADVKSSYNIVLSGARTSMLHGIPSMKAVEYGDLVLIDFGCKYHGYTADITRTVVVGKATKQQKEIYDLVLRINESCIQYMKPGMRASDIYEIAMNMIRETEYEKYFYQSFGHGIGLAVHQKPFIRAMSEDVLQENVIMTIEPGIYIPGWGGIRIEDDILIQKEGCKNLVSSPKQLIELF